MPVTAPAWYSPASLVTHLSERCARTQGRPATAIEEMYLLDDGAWCGRCASPEQRARLIEERRRGDLLADRTPAPALHDTTTGDE